MTSAFMLRRYPAFSLRRLGLLFAVLVLAACDATSDDPDSEQPGPDPAPLATYTPSLFADDLYATTSVTRLRDGRVLVVRYAVFDGSGTVLSFDADGSDRSEFITGLNAPKDVVELADGRLLVSEDDRIVAFDADGANPSVFAADLIGARGLVQLADGRVLVVESNDGKVTAFEADGSGRATFATNVLTGQSVAQLADGRVLVASFQTNQVLAFEADGSGRATFASVTAPTGLVQLPDGNVLVTVSGFSEGADTIVGYSASGARLGEVAAGLDLAQDLVRLPDGRVLVAELGGRVTALTPEAD